MSTVIQNISELEFAVFCIENVAAYLKVNPTELYEAFTEKSTILDDYILKNYETLHTQGKDYIIEDIVEVMEEKGCLNDYLSRVIS